MSDIKTNTPASNPITSIFTAHPASVDETYFQHMRFAMWFAGMAMLTAMAALIHAIIPALCEKTAGKLIGKMHARIENRHAH